MMAGLPWRVPPGGPFDLGSVDTASTEGAPGDKIVTQATFDGAKDRLLDLQERLFTEHSRSVLVVLQALDTGGKDGTIKHLFRGFNPVGARVASFKAPSEEEKAHDFLWRVHRTTPAAGELVVFNRSHYEDVLIVRVHGWVPEAVWRSRYDRINEFEQNLADAGTTIVKLWLHISPHEQKERLLARLEDPKKRWKFNPEDLEERQRWPDYMGAVEEMLQRTSTETAPWYVVPADKKWYRNWVVDQVLLATLEEMNPQYPDVPDGHYEIPDIEQ